MVNVGQDGRASRLHSGHMYSCLRRWDDPIQDTVVVHAEMPCQGTAFDRDTWRGLEHALVARVLKRQQGRIAGMPHDICMMHMSTDSSRAPDLHDTF